MTMNMTYFLKRMNYKSEASTFIFNHSLVFIVRSQDKIQEQMKRVTGFSVRGLFSPYILQIEAQMFIDS